jgi:site-specific DNA recombinase
MFDLNSLYLYSIQKLQYPMRNLLMGKLLPHMLAARKGCKEVLQGFALSQLTEVREMADDKQLTIIKEFTETVSASEPNERPEFLKMIEFIKAGKANGIVCFKMDRLARNSVDEGIIKHLLQKGQIQNIRSTDRSWYSDDHTLIWSVEFGTSTQYSRDLKKHIHRGQMEALRRGFRPCLAPLGYKNTKFREKGQNEVCLVDEHNFNLLRKMFDLILSREYTPNQVFEIATKQWGIRARKTTRYPNGKHLSSHSFYDILSNPFYFGDIDWKGEWYKGAHTPLITRAEFDGVQIILGRGSAKSKRHEHEYMGLMRCPCGARITCHKRFKTQMNGNQHTYSYYRCTGHMGPCPNKSMTRLEKLEGAFIEFLSSLQIAPEFHEWALAELRKEYERESGDKNSILFTQEKEYKRVKDMLDQLFEMRLAGDIDSDRYKDRREKLEEEERRLKGEIDAIDSRFKTWIDDAERLLTFAERAKEEFVNGDAQKRRAIISALGTEHVLYNGVLTIQTEKPLLLMREMASVENERENTFKPLNDVGTKGSFDEKDPSDSLRWRWGVLIPRPSPALRANLRRVVSIGVSARR